VAGIPLAAFGPAGGGVLFALVGPMLVLGFWAIASQRLGRAGKPAAPIRSAADAAWNLRDLPTDGKDPGDAKDAR
jgi:hypothetical protein